MLTPPAPHPTQPSRLRSLAPSTFVGVALALVFACGTAEAKTNAMDPAAGFDAVTRAAVKGRKVNYAEVEKRKASLRAYQTHVRAASVTKLSSSEKLAFYINAYNAHVLGAVLDNGLVKNGAGTGKGVLDVAGFFDKKRVVVAGAEMTLNELEKKYIRSAGDPRIHFVVNCASVDCPPLRARPYVAATLDAGLERQSRAFLTRKGEVVFDDATKTMKVVQLFEWYAGDFGGEAGVRKFIAKYVADPRVKTYRLTYRPYDWRLNATR